MRVEFSDELRAAVAVQDGVVARRQLLAVGISPEVIRSRLADGRWQRLHCGVYALFSGAPPRRAALWAAVLRAGRGAMLSHWTAAEVDGLARPREGVIHVSVPAGRHVLPVEGLAIHRSERAEAARPHPTRLPPRTRLEETVLDLAGSAASCEEAFDWLCQACAGRFTTPGRLRVALERRGRIGWRAEISAALDDVADGVHSGLERRYCRDVERAHDLPSGIRQARVARGRRSEYRDVLYEEYGVAVETDGKSAHPARDRWRDIARDNAAAASGVTTLRYSWADVRFRPCAVASEVAMVLRRHGWNGLPQRCGSECSVPSMILISGSRPGRGASR